MTTPVVIELAWPDARLKPNSRVHFMSLATAKKAAKESAAWAARIALQRRFFVHDGASDIILKQVAHPPDKRERDRDNLDASLKAARDGIAVALGVNDKHFRPTGIEWGDIIPGGKIVITVGADA